MLDHSEYTTEVDYHQGNGNSYHHLNGDWALYYKIAKGFIRRVKPEDRQDFLHDLFLTMAKVKAKYQVIDKPLTEGGLVRVASFAVAQYWRDYYQHINGVDCGRCSNSQRKQCKEKDLYRECPRAIKIESLDMAVEDGNGDSTELHELIADDNAVDIVARLEARLTLKSYPHRFVMIAYKKYAGYQITKSEQQYYWREAKKAQKKLVLV